VLGPIDEKQRPIIAISKLKVLTVGMEIASEALSPLHNRRKPSCKQQPFKNHQMICMS
jgi:hypothetical protein